MRKWLGVHPCWLPACLILSPRIPLANPLHPQAVAPTFGVPEHCFVRPTREVERAGYHHGHCGVETASYLASCLSGSSFRCVGLAAGRRLWPCAPCAAPRDTLRADADDVAKTDRRGEPPPSPPR